MRVAIVAIVALAFCAFALATPTLEEQEFVFTKFIQHHNKKYESLEEFNKRFNIFRSNWALIQKHNAEAAKGRHTFTLALNRFADMTNPEYRQTMLTYRSRPRDRVASSVHQPQHVQALPATVDWRTQNVVTPVKDQGQCGSCWAFSAVGSMEGAHAYKTKNLISLSEQELVDCANGGQNTCDVGGQMTDGFTWGTQKGMELESDYPYQASSGNPCRWSASKVKATFNGYSNVTSGSEADLQSAVANQPTVSVAIDASSIWFQLYGGGVYNDASCKNGENDLDHGVLAVGYGNYQGSDYWLVKNSWGSSWGLQGYIMMSRNKSNQCGIATDASYPLV